MKKPWNTLFHIFLILTVIGFTTVALNFSNKTDILDPFNSTWLGIILNINSLLSPLELVMTIISYFQGKW